MLRVAATLKFDDVTRYMNEKKRKTRKPSKRYKLNKRKRLAEKKANPAPPRPKLNKRGLLRISDEAVQEMILGLCREAGLAGDVRPETIARALYPDQWQTMLKRVRFTAKQLTTKGDLLILRKGQPVEPDEMKGLVRLRITEQGLGAMDEEE